MLSFGFVQTDKTLRDSRCQRETALRKQDPRNTERIEQNRSQRCHDDLQNRIEHGGYRISFLLGTFRNQFRINACERQLVYCAKAGQQQGNRQIAHIRKLKKQQPYAHSGKQNCICSIARYQKRFTGKPVHERRNQNREQKIRQKLDRDNQRGRQRAAGFVKHQESQCKTAGDCAQRTNGRRKDYQAEVS